ncbi:cobalamin-binding protein [Haloprofundus marisrubri]|uniref:Cobalamin-binding protein n=1 Tax=Haloprofundus marisrubri TaxID=1514971 RepID=A0A0W1R8A9_9EURY|nr:helical backbone metal receptor [Haloprofundus marisrubri]KTG09660.1 cobalamin-binding protein [Haloprofundus marisrubri]
MTRPDADGKRVVSLAPSATATLDAMGASDGLVGATLHCDTDVPAVGGWLNPDYDHLAELDPELVCTSDALQREVRDELRSRGYRVHHVEPATLSDVLDSFAEIGEAVGRPDAGEALRAGAEARLDAVADCVADRAADELRPVVYCEEWSDPPMAAGNWVPDAVVAAGGRYPFVESGERSHEVDRETVVSADPDHAILHVCGRGDRVDPSVVTDRDWAIDPEVHVVDDSLLNQPSPRLVDGIETLADLLH